MAVALEWADPGVPVFEETDKDADGESVFETWPQAKQAAIDSAIDNRELWASCVRRLRTMSRAEAVE